MALFPAAPVLESSLRDYRGTWKGSVISAFLAPLLYLASLGFGLGALVDRGGAAGPGGVPYARFVAPGLLAATAMQVAIGESTYPVLGAVIWQRHYHAMLATPMRVVDVLIGHAAFIGLRVVLSTVCFALVGALIGALSGPWLPVAVLIAVLCGLAHVPVVMAYAVRQENDNGLAVLFRLVMMPMFLFAGTFYPVDRLPVVLRPVAWATPLWHGTDAVRALLLGRAQLPSVLGHVAYLGLWVIGGLVVARYHYQRRLAS